MSYPQKSYFASDRINQNKQMIKSIFISPKKQIKSSIFSTIQFKNCFYHSKPIKYLCISQTCQSKYYTICDHEQCKNIHYHPNLNVIQLQKFQQFKQAHLKSINLLKQKINQHEKNVIEMVLHKISKDFELVRGIVDKFYVHEAVKKISQGNFESLTAKDLNQFIQKSIQTNKISSDTCEQSFLDSKNMIIESMQKISESIKKLTQTKQYKVLTLQSVIIENNQSLSKNSPIKSHIKKQTFTSKIIQFQQEYQTLIKMLRQNRITNFQQFKLLYRGSEHQFSANQYHNAVHNKMPIFLILLAETGRKFGAFLNCKTIKNNQWISDPTGLSFIFSLDHNQTYRIKPSAQFRTKAIFGGQKGPQIGLGCDIYISDRCHQNIQSGSNFGGSFQLPFGLDFNTKKAKCYLGGKQNFRVLQYEVYILI